MLIADMKIAIITGGSNGIGKATALELARRGTGVILTYHSHRSGAEEVVREIEATGGQAIALKLDLSQSSTFTEFTTEVAAQLQQTWQRTTFDHLINNGGIGGGTPFDQIDEANFDLVMDTNFKGPFFLTQHLLPHLADGGRIVNVSSGASRIAPPGYSAYGPSKAALSCWTRYLAKELSPRGIRVNTVSPGPVLTNLADGAFAKHPEFIQPLADQTALGRIGQPEDLAKVIANLLEDDFGWVTAQDIEVSGGFLL